MIVLKKQKSLDRWSPAGEHVMVTQGDSNSYLTGTTIYLKGDIVSETPVMITVTMETMVT